MSTHCLHKTGHRGEGMALACCRCDLVAHVHELAPDEVEEPTCGQPDPVRKGVEWWKAPLVAVEVVLAETCAPTLADARVPVPVPASP